MTHIPLGFKTRLYADNEWFPTVVENEVVPLPTFGEILLGVVNDTICTDRSDHVQIPRTAYASDIGAERLGDLNSERPYASRRTVNQDLLPGLNLSLVAKTLQAVNATGKEAACSNVTLSG